MWQFPPSTSCSSTRSRPICKSSPAWNSTPPTATSSAPPTSAAILATMVQARTTTENTHLPERDEYSPSFRRWHRLTAENNQRNLPLCFLGRRAAGDIALHEHRGAVLQLGRRLQLVDDSLLSNDLRLSVRSLEHG